MSSHIGVSCDVCLKINLSNRRYKCLICDNYDLCGLCYDRNSESQYHKNTHPMQCILTKTAYELFYSGESIPYRTIVSLTCPYCSRSGFIPQTLFKHCLEQHSDNKTSRMCPICVLNQIEGHQIRYFSLIDHLTKEHDQEISSLSQQKINDITEDFEHVDENEDEGLPLYILAERLFLKEENRRQRLIQNDINSQQRSLSRQIGIRGTRGNLRGHPYGTIPRATLRSFRIPFDTAVASDPYATILFAQDPLFDYDAPFCLTPSTTNHLPSAESITNEQKQLNSNHFQQPDLFMESSSEENLCNNPRSLLGKILKTMTKSTNEQDRVLFLQSLFYSSLNISINNE